MGHGWRCAWPGERRRGGNPLRCRPSPDLLPRPPVIMEPPSAVGPYRICLSRCRPLSDVPVPPPALTRESIRVFFNRRPLSDLPVPPPALTRCHGTYSVSRRACGPLQFCLFVPPPCPPSHRYSVLRRRPSPDLPIPPAALTRSACSADDFYRVCLFRRRPLPDLPLRCQWPRPSPDLPVSTPALLLVRYFRRIMISILTRPDCKTPVHLFKDLMRIKLE